METSQDIRCGECNRKLGAGQYIQLNIKCPRCGTMNHLKAASLPVERHSTPNLEGDSRGKFPSRYPMDRR